MPRSHPRDVVRRRLGEVADACVVVGRLRSAVVDLLEAYGVAPGRGAASLPSSH